MMSVTSSTTPGIDENSCSTPSMLTAVIAAPSIEESRQRRRALPMVVAKPALERLGREPAVRRGQGLGIDLDALGALKTFPKHMRVSFPGFRLAAQRL